MLIKGRHHITYCTNIHPGQDWQSTFKHIQEHVPTIKKAICAQDRFGLGLRLSNKASEELNRGNNFEAFRTWLNKENIYVFTMNGFPYGNFHNERVKDKVYAPDWTTNDRVIYTKRLFDQLAALIPEGINGGISTLPISYKHWHSSEKEVHEVFSKGALNIGQIVLHLLEIERVTGKYLHLDIEPEPDCLLENSDEFISFFESYLIPIVSEQLQHTLEIDEQRSRQIVLRYVTLCYDICHFSLAYEEPVETFKKLESKSISIGKIQVSAALKMLFSEGNNANVWDSLAPFDEPVYLHQVTEKVGDKVRTYNDLPALFKNKKEFKELRAHFHVPIFLEQFEALYSTQDQILAVLEILKTKTVSEHLEVETYTWDVLPAGLKMDITGSIIRELSWLKERL